MASSRAKIHFECKTKQFTDADFCRRETIFLRYLLEGEGSNSFTLTKWKFETSF